MSLYSYILYASILFWIFPAFRQYKGKYFLFFLLQAIADPISLLANFIGIQTNIIALAVFILQAVVVIKYDISKMTVFILIPIILIVAYIGGSLNYKWNLWIPIITSSIILFIILKTLSMDLFYNRTLNLYYIIFIILEGTYITRIISVLNELQTGIQFHFLTGIFQILIALFFSFFREDNPKISFSLK